MCRSSESWRLKSKGEPGTSKKARQEPSSISKKVERPAFVYRPRLPRWLREIFVLDLSVEQVGHGLEAASLEVCATKAQTSKSCQEGEKEHG
jgi:hypothetical protein